MKNTGFEMKFANALSDLGLDYNDTTLDAIKYVTKEAEPNFEALFNLVQHNQNRLIFGRNKGASYAFVILKNTIATNYEHEKEMLIAHKQYSFVLDFNIQQSIRKTLSDSLLSNNVGF